MNTKMTFGIGCLVSAIVGGALFLTVQAADEKPPRYDADNPKPGTPIDAEKLRRLAWGPPATNGLRAACYFEPTKEAYADGEVVKSWQVFHNSGKEPLCFTVTHGGSPAEWIVVDEQDRKVPLDQLYPYGKLVLETFRLEPGHAKEFERASTGIGASTKASGPADTAIQAKPGTTCRVRWTLSLAGTTHSDGKYVPTPGVWHDKLTTGEVRFRIVEKGSASDPQRLPFQSKAEDSIPLAETIKAFNAKAAVDAIGKDQPPLTEDEVVAAIRARERPRDPELSDMIYRTLQQIAESRQFPANAEFESLNGRSDGDYFFDLWSVRINVDRTPAAGVYTLVIRDQVIRSRTLDEELERVSTLLLKRGPQRFPGEYRLDEYYQELKVRKRAKDEHGSTPK